MVLKATNPTAAALYLSHARELYAWGSTAPQGLYSNTLPGYPDWLYATGRYRDKLMLASSWLYRATGEAPYLTAAHGYWAAESGVMGMGDISPYVSYSSLWGPAAANMLT